MDSSSTTLDHPRLEPVLRRLRQRIRRMLATRGILISGVTALAGLLVIAALDYAFSPLPSFIRWMCPLVWLAAIATTAYVSLWRALRQPLDLVRIARWLENRHPELDERVSTVLEVSGHSDSGTSTRLLEELAKEAASFLIEIDPQVEVSARRVRRWLWPVAALVVIWGVLFAVWPNLTARFVVRTLAPGSNLGTAAGRITVTPGSIEVIEGDAVEITARHSAGAQMPLELVLHLNDGSQAVMPMEIRDQGSVYQLGRAGPSFEYEIRAGRDTSDRYKISVWPQPRLANSKVRLEFPAYTGWAAREQALGGNIGAIIGTKVELRSKLNTPVDTVRLEIDGQTVGTTTVERGAEGGNLSSRWTFDKPGPGTARIVLKHRLGREVEGARFTIDARGDTLPEVRWVGADPKELRLRADELLERGYEVTDDVGIKVVEMEVQPENGDAARLPVAAPPRSGSDEAPVWRGGIHQEIGVLVSRWPQSPVFKLRMRVEDTRPADLGGPGVGTSEWVVVRIDAGAQSLARQEVFAAHAEARATLEQARQLVQQAREKMDRRRPEVLREEKLPEDARKELAQAREQLAEAHDKLANLANRMEETVHAAKAPEVRETAALVEQAQQQLENAPLQDTPQQRDQNVGAARENAEKAEQQLAKLRDEIQSKESQLQEYARLKELEQQQREIARQAEQAIARNPQNPQPPQDPSKPPTPAEKAPTPQWQQQQNAVAEALRQTAQQQPEAQAAALEQQAKEATELAAEAKKQASAQETLKQETASPTSPTNPTAQSEKSNAAANEAAQLAEAIRETPQINGPSGPMQQAAQSSQQASTQAQQAAQSGAQNKPAEASSLHAQSSQQLQQTAARLTQAAAEFSQQAAQAAARQPTPQQAPIPGQALASAFEQAAQAATANSKETAASQSRAAAEALSTATAKTMTAMQGKGEGKGKGKGKPGQPGEPGQPGSNPDENMRTPLPDPGVPPELAKLGISAADWEIIKASLKAETGPSSAILMPEEYRDLVRRYFEEITKGTPK